MLKKVALISQSPPRRCSCSSRLPGASSSKGSDSLRGLRCVAAGVNFLVENKLLGAAARQQVDYDTIDSDSGGSEGLINTDLPTPSFLPLWTVIKLHYTNPELFDWCN